MCVLVDAINVLTCIEEIYGEIIYRLLYFGMQCRLEMQAPCEHRCEGCSKLKHQDLKKQKLCVIRIIIMQIYCIADDVDGTLRCWYRCE